MGRGEKVSSPASVYLEPDVCFRSDFFLFLLHSYRFMVIDRLGVDLQKVLEKEGNRFAKATTLEIGCQLVSNGYNT